MAGKSLKSTHGRQLLNLLQEVTVFSSGQPVSLDSLSLVEQVQEIMKKDVLASRLSDNESGNNAFHILLSTSLAAEILINLIKCMSQHGPEGLKKANKHGDLPLHVYLLNRSVSVEVTKAILEIFPGAASVENGQGLIPLFLCAMREEISTEVVKSLCRTYPEGPATLNSTNSHPLHFAAKKQRPNKELLRILLRRCPQAASKVNDFGLLPLHCAAAFADDEEAVSMIYEANKAAIVTPDRQGRLPIHLAVLAVGTDHTNAVQQETEEQVFQLRMQMQQMCVNQSSKRDEEDHNEDDDDDHDVRARKKVEEDKKNSWQLQEVGQRSRKVVYFLARTAPISLCIRNNFEAVPVDTVLTKAKPERTKRKVVSVFGLFDDPITARLLLLLHREAICSHWSAAPLAREIPPMIGKHLETLRELNWMARRPALLASYQGQSLFPGKDTTIFKAANKLSNQSSKWNKASSTIPVVHEIAVGGGEIGVIHYHNMIARLRHYGVVELVRHVFEYL